MQVENLIKAKVGDVTVEVYTYVTEGPVGSDYRTFCVAADDAEGQRFFAKDFDTPSKAFNEFHRFVMAEFAPSVYVIDAEDEAAFRPFE